MPNSRFSQEDYAFESSLNRRFRFLFRVAYALLRDSQAAEDVAQERFISL
jgi:DNA-directed RNA polymerase specialized sigma24 family protein